MARAGDAYLSMAFSKNKALENALKFLNQGKVAQAIGEYQQILRHDSKDQATLMTVGDLFARQGDMPQAIDYFERLAQVYLSDGFNSKAIAIYKKIVKLAPNELVPLERLADLYVQQGVLSEARPLFLQIAEAHLKSNRAAKAVEVLHRLLEVEPDSPRVQMRLAELYNVMGQKGEAAQTYFSYAQRLFERGEAEEAHKLIDRALELDPGNGATQLLKARILGLAGKNEEAIAILEKHPEADAGGDITNMLVDLDLAASLFDKAADRARNQLVRGSTHFRLLLKAAESMVQHGNPGAALSLFRELRDPMSEAGEQDEFLKALSRAIERMPGDPEPLEFLADFSRHSSDPFHLNSALNQLADIYAQKQDFSRAEAALEELIDHNRGDERLTARLEQLRARASGKGEEVAPDNAELSPPAVPAPAEIAVHHSAARLEELPAETALEADAKTSEEPLDEETRQYITQALTDVDLFSSYGLMQKAAHLLESILVRAPRHVPTLERLLDLYLGSGNVNGTVELATRLEQISTECGDTTSAERFSEIRARYQKTTAPAAEEPSVASAVAPPDLPVAVQPQEQSSAEGGAPPADFEIPLAEEPEPAPEAAPVVQGDAHPGDSAPATPELSAAVEEVDLSDEWEAMAQEVVDQPPAASEAVAPPQEEPVAIEMAGEPEPGTQELPAEAVASDAAAPEEDAVQMPVTEGAASSSGTLELELTPEVEDAKARIEPATTDEFLSELAAEIEGLDAPAPAAAETAETAPAAPPAPAAATSDSQEAVPAGTPAPATADGLKELAEVFQEFRNELGEMSDEDEDLEMHYNLGIAYREMGLLDEAIGEFQKVAKAVQKGKPFAYAMNCSTLLAISFMDKGEPKIAALWYQRALATPGIDQEALLALRYDLGLSLETAGEISSALDSFRQVYAMNIDYRDVAERITMLQKQLAPLQSLRG